MAELENLKEARHVYVQMMCGYILLPMPMVDVIIAALEDRDRLRAEIRELRGLGWEHLKRDKFPIIRAVLEGRDG